jgi:hypothetical protein
MEPHTHNEKPQDHPESDAENPVSQKTGPGGLADQEAIRRDSREGINPQNTGSMARAEDDASTFANSPEFHDRSVRRG